MRGGTLTKMNMVMLRGGEATVGERSQFSELVMNEGWSVTSHSFAFMVHLTEDNTRRRWSYTKAICCVVNIHSVVSFGFLFDIVHLGIQSVSNLILVLAVLAPRAAYHSR